MRTLVKLLFALAVGAGGLIAAGALLVPSARLIFTAGSSGGSTDVLKLTELPETSNVYDDQGNLIATFHADQNRVPVTFSQVPTSVVNAVVDTEDAKFWVHHGVNIWAVARALFSNGKGGRGPAGRVDHRPAADQEHRAHGPAHPHPQAQGGGARGPPRRRAEQAADHGALPQHGLLRQRRLRDRRGRGGVLRRAGRAPHARAGRAPGRDHPGPERATTRSCTPTRRCSAATW